MELNDMEQTKTSNRNSDTEKKWSLPPIHRHLKTIGIGEAFASPIPIDMLYNKGKLSLESQFNDDNTVTTVSWEIMGSIKSEPEDFVVREIGGIVDTKNSKGKTADLTDTDTIPPLKVDHSEYTKPTHDCITNQSKESTVRDNSQVKRQCQESNSIVKIKDDNNNLDKVKPNVSNEKENNCLVSESGMKADSRKDQQLGVLKVGSPKEAVKKMLDCCLSKLKISSGNFNDSDGKELYQLIQKMYDEAYKFVHSHDVVLDRQIDKQVEDNQISSVDSQKNAEIDRYIALSDKNVLWVPPIIDNKIIEIESDSSKYGNDRAGNRGTFHKSLKVAFPLLKSETVSIIEGENFINQRKVGQDDIIVVVDDKGETIAPNKNRWIKIGIDTTFFDLIKYAAFPSEDLIGLYLFRNKGCDGQSTANKGHHSKNKKSRYKKRGSNDRSSPGNDDTSIFLRLLPCLTKDERRNIHTIFAKNSKELETGTKHDVPLFQKSDGTTVDATSKTTAITICWSQQTQRIAFRKRKRTKSSESQATPQKVQNTLCILKKKNVEHLAAINHLVMALKCRQSDIGLAGIKDMRAVTYQFCTLTNIAPKRAQRANSILRKQNLELGNFERVDWSINLGNLFGNMFDIVIRGLRRIEIRRKKMKSMPTSDGSESDEIIEEECFLPCDVRHMDVMVERLQKFGFVNFYGEQRVGDAGKESDVGVRSFDIGRAMLQQNYEKAIDLLMTGRLKNRNGAYIETPRDRKVRETWKVSGGNVNKTLEESSRSNTMLRERTVLKGLKRYGSDNPLAAMRCLHHRVRMFWINGYQSYVWNIAATERIIRLGTKVAVGDLYMDDDTKKVHFVEDDTSQIKLSQIVLPLPGYNIIYPKNEIGNIYKDILEKDEIDFHKNKSVPEATAKGTYRHLIVYPNELKWETVEECNQSPGIIEAAKLSFSLPSGSYATMLMRELMCTTLSR